MRYEVRHEACGTVVGDDLPDPYPVEEGVALYCPACGVAFWHVTRDAGPAGGAEPVAPVPEPEPPDEPDTAGRDPAPAPEPPADEPAPEAPPSVAEALAAAPPAALEAVAASAPDLARPPGRRGPSVWPVLGLIALTGLLVLVVVVLVATSGR